MTLERASFGFSSHRITLTLFRTDRSFIATTFRRFFLELSHFFGLNHQWTFEDSPLPRLKSSRARALLVEAAWALLRWKTPKTEALHEWATRIAARRGKATAVVALARKLVGIMFAIWRDGTEFNPEHVTRALVQIAVAGYAETQHGLTLRGQDCLP
jgi:hypothetical protein